MRPVAGPPAGPRTECWTWLLVLLLLAALGVHVWPELVPWRAQTLHRDLPYAGLCVAALALLFVPARRSRGLGSSPAAIRMTGRARWIALAGVMGALALLVALPTVLARSRAGLAVQTGGQWRAPGAPTDPQPARRLDFGPESGGIWGRAPFYAAISGWLYIPAEGTYHVAVDADADAMVEIDGRAEVGRGAPGGLKPPGVTDAATGFRRARVYLETGYHFVQILSRHEAGSARLRVRWIPPWLSRAVTIPTDHLLPAGSTLEEIRLRSVALVGRRIAILGLACLSLAILAVVLTGFGDRAVRPAGMRMDRAHAAGFGLLFLMLTGIPLLIWSEHERAVARLLLGVIAAGGLVIGIRSLLRSRAQGVTGAGRRRGWPDRVRRAWPALALLVVQAALSIRFLAFVAGRLPMPGDHSSFLYRYHALLHTLPRLRGYDPWWNAGTTDSCWAISGATGILGLFWPLLAVWRLPDVYAALPLLVGAGVVPWSLFWTVRLLGGSRLAALLAGLLALAPGDVYFWWLMAHGTLPAIVSASIAPLVIALAWRVFVRHDPRRILVVALGVALTLGSFWAGFVPIVGPGLLIGTAICWRRLRRRDLLLAAGLAAGVILIHSHWLLGLLGSPQILYTTPRESDPLTWRQFVEASLQPIVTDPNPVALVLGVVGTFLLPGPLRWVYAGFVLSLLGTATLLRPLFPLLELDRFFVAFGLALIPPAAWVGARLLRSLARGPSRSLAVLASLGLVGVLWLHMDGVWRQYGGQIRRTARQMDFQSDPTRHLVDWIRASTAPSARILIVGDLPGPGRLEGGYKAYLQPLTGRPLVGLPVNVKCVDLDALALLEGPDLRGALEAFNIRHVVIRADDPPMQARLDESAVLRLREVLSAFRVYDVDVPPTYLIGARGTVDFDYDRLDVRLEDPVDRVTLKFRWAQGLVTDPPLPLEPVEVLPGVRFIGVRTAGTRAFRVRYTDCCAWHPVEAWARWREARP